MKTVQNLLPAAIAAVEEHILKGVPNAKYDKEFKGYISSFGAGIISAGLLPALIFFSDKGNSNADRYLIIKCFESILKSDKRITEGDPLFISENGSLLLTVKKLIEENKTVELNRITQKITDAAIALKLALRTFTEKENNNDND